MGYAKIYNLYRPEAQTVLLFKEVYAMEKLHGCLEANTTILTEDGPQSIQDICDKQYRGKTLSFDPKTGKVLFRTINGHSVGEETDEWFEITLDNGRTITATANHRFWIEECKCWRSLSDLKAGDKLTTV